MSCEARTVLRGEGGLAVVRAGPSRQFRCHQIEPIIPPYISTSRHRRPLYGLLWTKSQLNPDICLSWKGYDQGKTPKEVSDPESSPDYRQVLMDSF
jgi:hypothetical protein